MTTDKEHIEELVRQLAQMTDPFELTVLTRALAAQRKDLACAAPALADMLSLPAAETAASAAFLLSEIGPEACRHCPELPRVLAAQLNHADGEVRHWVSVALGRLGNEAAGSLPELKACLDDPDEGVVVNTLHILEEIHPEPGQVVSTVLPLLKRESPAVRRSAAYCLAHIDPDGTHSREALASFLNTGGLAALDAARAILAMPGIMSSLREKAFQYLTERLQDKGETRRITVEILGEQETFPETIQSILVQALKDTEPDTRFEILKILMRITPLPPGISEQLSMDLEQGDSEIRQAILLLLEQPLPLDTQTKNSLVEKVCLCLQDPDTQVRRQAVRVLNAWETKNAQILDAILGLIQEPEAETRRVIAEILSRFSGEEAKKALRTLNTDSHPAVRLMATVSLWKLDPEYGRQAIKAIQAALSPTDSASCLAALKVLRLSDMDKTPFLDAVQRVSQSAENSLIQEMAEELLKSINR